MKTVLAAIDFSRVSRQVIAVAIDLARPMKARVVLLHVVPPPAVEKELAPLTGEIFRFTDVLEKGARRHLWRFQHDLAQRRISVETRCEKGPAIEQIIAAAEGQATAYIVLGAHGLARFRPHAIGGTAGGVIRTAPCPVVVVPARLRLSIPRPRRGKRNLRGEE